VQFDKCLHFVSEKRRCLLFCAWLG